ncbi:MAG: type IV secretion system DNA-binding domain-containing protein [Planctomycetaceae bacterium]|nr:type IV secretion system DNA-binding domain-containing protein [Planctomycetaceae bacterium]
MSSDMIHGNRIEDIGYLFDKSAGGIQISGDSGAGKSNGMCVLMQHCIRLGQPFVFIDPHGRDAASIRNWILLRGTRAAQRMIYIEPSNPLAPLPCINPLSISDGRDAFYARAEITNKVGHVAEILLHAWGEHEGFTGRPRLFTWLYRILRQLALLGLSMADAVHFLDIGSEIYQLLVKNVADPMAKVAFEELAGSRLKEQKEEIESTRNRLLGFVDQNPIVTHMVGRTHDVLDFRQLMHGGFFVIIDLRKGGVLRPEDQQIFANLFLAELLHTVFNLPESECRPYLAFIDELPVFAPSFPQITSALAQVRKFNLRFVLAHQGVNMFPDRTQDRLLQACTSLCGVKLYFRHTNPTDAKFFGEVIGLRTYDPGKVKYEHITPTQFHDGYDFKEIVDHAENWSDTRTQSHAKMLGESLKPTIDGVKSTHSNQNTNANSNASTAGGSRTYKTVPLARMKWRDVVSSVQFFTPDEQDRDVAQQIAALNTGEAFLVVSAAETTRVTFPLAKRRLQRAPKYIATKDAEYRNLLASRPEFDFANELEIERLTFNRRLIVALTERLRSGLMDDMASGYQDSENTENPTPPGIGI